MDVMTAIKERVSVRAFKPAPVSKEVIEKLLQAGIKAPSGFNESGWKFWVVTGQTKRKLDDLLVPCAPEGVQFSVRQAGIDAKTGGRIGKHRTEFTVAQFEFIKKIGMTLEDTTKFILRHYDAPVAIFITEEKIKQNALMVGCDTGSAVQNIMLAACDSGLGTCWMTFPYIRTKSAAPIIKKYLKIPANEKLICSIAVGYPDEKSPLSGFKTSRDEFNSFVEWIGWA